MSVSSICLWVCDLCSLHVAQAKSASPYDDPIVMPPLDWRYDFPVPISHQKSPLDDSCHACPACVAAPVWSNYNWDKR